MFKFLYISWCISCIHVYNINNRNHIICACVCVHNSCAISILYFGFDIPRFNVLDKSYGPISIHNCGWIADPCFALTTQCHSDALHKHDLWGSEPPVKRHVWAPKSRKIYRSTVPRKRNICKKETCKRGRGPWPMLNHSQVDSPILHYSLPR